MGNSTLQLAAAPHMRGRVMALWAVAFLGSTPIGGPIAGAVSQEWGGRAGLALGAAACLVAALMGLIVLRRTRARERAAQGLKSSGDTSSRNSRNSSICSSGGASVPSGKISEIG